MTVHIGIVFLERLKLTQLIHFSDDLMTYIVTSSNIENRCNKKQCWDGLPICGHFKMAAIEICEINVCLVDTCRYFVVICSNIN